MVLAKKVASVMRKHGIATPAGVRFSLKSIFLLVTVVVVALFWRDRVRIQHYRSLQELEARGAILSDGWEDSIGPNFLWTGDVTYLFDTPTNGMLEHILGVGEWFPRSPLCTTGTFRCIIENADRTGKELQLVSNLLHLKHLSVYGKQIETSALEDLRRNSEPRTLDLGFGAMSEKHLKFLHCLNGLQSLWIADGTYSREALVELRQALPSCNITIGDVELPK